MSKRIDELVDNIHSSKVKVAVTLRLNEEDLKRLDTLAKTLSTNRQTLLEEFTLDSIRDLELKLKSLEDENKNLT